MKVESLLGKFSPLVSRLVKQIDGGIELWLDKAGRGCDEVKSLPLLVALESKGLTSRGVFRKFL